MPPIYSLSNLPNRVGIPKRYKLVIADGFIRRKRVLDLQITTLTQYMIPRLFMLKLIIGFIICLFQSIDNVIK